MDRLLRDQTVAMFDGPEPDEICCSNCEFFDGKWCEIKDYRVLRPWAFSCIDFQKEENDND